MGLIAAAALLHLVRRSAAANTSCCCNSYLFRNTSHLHLLYFSTASTTKPAPNATSPPSFPEEFFVEKFQFSSEIASKAASFSARSRNPQNAILLLSLLRDKGFSHSHLERIVRYHPKVLSLCVETNVKPKFKVFEDLGLSAGEAAQVVARDFQILHQGANRTMGSLSVLKDLLGSTDNVIKLIKKHPGLFRSNPEKTLLPNIELLKTCGVQIEQINIMLYNHPSFLFISPENMRRCVGKCDEMGVQRSSRMFIHAVKAFGTMSDETLELKLKSFRDLGFPEDDILRMFRTAPSVIALSTRNINEVKQVLLETGKYDVPCISNCPISLLYSVEKRYRPRLQVLKVLERKSLITRWPTLSSLGTMTDKRFFDRFVAPNINEVGEDFIAKTAFTGKVDTASLKAKSR